MVQKGLEAFAEAPCGGLGPQGAGGLDRHHRRVSRDEIMPSLCRVSNVIYDGSQLATVSIIDPVPSLDIVAAYPRGVRLTRKAQAFIRSSIAARQSPVSEIPHEGL